MSVQLRGAAAVPSGNPTTSFTVTIPSQTVSGDWLFLAAVSRDHTAGTGLATCTDDDTGGNAWSAIYTSTDRKVYVFRKQATSGTASKTVTFGSAVGSSAGVLKVFFGTTGTTDNIVAESNASGNETHAGWTPAEDGEMLFGMVFNYANDNAVTSLSFATAGATTMTEKLSTGGSDSAVAFGHVLGTAAGTGALTWAQTDGTTYSVTMGIRPTVHTGTGAISVPPPTTSGTGAEVFTATGAVTVPSATVAGTGVEVFTATGAVSVPAPTVAGTGDHTGGVVEPSATGAVSVPSATVSGTGALILTGTGAISVPSATVAGSGAEVFTATGAIAVPPPSVAGSGAHIQNATGTGAISVPAPAVVGAGLHVQNVTGTGAITVPAPNVSGVGVAPSQGGPTLVRRMRRRVIPPVVQVDDDESFTLLL